MAQRELQLILDLKDNASKELKGFRGNLKSAGKSMKSVGGTMTRSITTPLVGAAAAATKFSSDFEQQAQQVRSTANLTSDEIDRISESVGDIAVETGESTDKIFMAMQKAVSGSLDVAQSQELVAEAAKASAAGFGEMEELVNVSTTAFDAFGKEGGSAEEILNEIVRAAQNTQVQVDEMARSFNRSAFTASNLGINQSELASILGVVSERFGDTQRGGRALSQMLIGLQDPSGDAATAINNVFGSVSEFQELLSEDAIGTLVKMKKELEATGGGLEDVFTTSQRLNAAEALLADNGERVNEVLEQQADSASAIADAFSNSESFTRLLSRAFQALQKALRPIGDILIKQLSPILETFIEKIQALSKWFTELSPTMQKAIFIFAGLLAILGPVLTVIGTLTIAISAISAPVLIAIGAITGLIGAGVALVSKWKSVKKFFTGLLDSMKPLIIAIKQFTKGVIKSMKPALNSISENFKVLWNDIKDLWDLLKPILIPALKGLAKIVGVVLVGAIGTLTAAISGLVNVFSGLFDIVRAIASPIINFIKGILKPFSQIGEVLGMIKGRGLGIGTLFSGFDIPQLAEGGIVTRPTLAMVGEAGPEAVVPLDKGTGGKKVVINVNGGTYLDRQAADEIFEQLSSRIRREFRL